MSNIIIYNWGYASVLVRPTSFSFRLTVSEGCSTVHVTDRRIDDVGIKSVSRDRVLAILPNVYLEMIW